MLPETPTVGWCTSHTSRNLTNPAGICFSPPLAGLHRMKKASFPRGLLSPELYAQMMTSGPGLQTSQTSLTFNHQSGVILHHLQHACGGSQRMASQGASHHTDEHKHGSQETRYDSVCQTRLNQTLIQFSKPLRARVGIVHQHLQQECE